jgi:hypothetical protein
VGCCELLITEAACGCARDTGLGAAGAITRLGGAGTAGAGCGIFTSTVLIGSGSFTWGMEIFGGAVLTTGGGGRGFGIGFGLTGSIGFRGSVRLISRRRCCSSTVFFAAAPMMQTIIAKMTLMVTEVNNDPLLCCPSCRIPKCENCTLAGCGSSVRSGLAISKVLFVDTAPAEEVEHWDQSG